jgi:uncharacterized integral membrane protein (TIGR02327 family)
MMLTIGCIVLCWWALQAFKFDLFIRQVNGAQSKLLQLIVSVVLGHGLAQFFIQYIEWTNLLTAFF